MLTLVLRLFQMATSESWSCVTSKVLWRSTPFLAPSVWYPSMWSLAACVVKATEVVVLDIKVVTRTVDARCRRPGKHAVVDALAVVVPGGHARPLVPDTGVRCVQPVEQVVFDGGTLSWVDVDDAGPVGPARALGNPAVANRHILSGYFDPAGDPPAVDDSVVSSNRVGAVFRLSEAGACGVAGVARSRPAAGHEVRPHLAHAVGSRTCRCRCRRGCDSRRRRRRGIGRE